MDKYTAAEEGFKRGYEKGYEAGKRDAVGVAHGRWERTEQYGFLCCSKCKDVYVEDEWITDGKWGYCPNCGAKMDGGNDNE